MTWEVMSEPDWAEIFRAKLDEVGDKKPSFVTGAGRSGAVAAVYASHYLGVPFKPHKAGNYKCDHSVLIVDTVEYTGKTLRKAAAWYARRGLDVETCFGVKEVAGHYYRMWYEVRC